MCWPRIILGKSLGKESGFGKVWVQDNMEANKKEFIDTKNKRILMSRISHSLKVSKS